MNRSSEDSLSVHFLKGFQRSRLVFFVVMPCLSFAHISRGSECAFSFVDRLSGLCLAKRARTQKEFHETGGNSQCHDRCEIRLSAHQILITVFYPTFLAMATDSIHPFLKFCKKHFEQERSGEIA